MRKRRSAGRPNWGSRHYPRPVSASNQQVTALIARRARPLLRDYGFADFTGRRAWFVEDEVISLVTFNAVGSYFAGAVRCTPHSFSVEAGVFYRVFDRDLLRPQDHDLTFRFLLGKYGRQKLVSPHRPDIWFAAEDAQNLEALVEDAVQAVHDQALPGLTRFRDAQLAFDALLTVGSSDVDYGTPALWMPGAPGSHHWTDAAEAVGRLVTEDPSPSIRSAPVLARE